MGDLPSNKRNITSPDSNLFLDVEDDFDGESAYSTSISDFTSIRSSVLQYQGENGRTYHAMSSGKYVYPNDDLESQRLEPQHNVWLLMLKGEHVLCPYAAKGANRVLDCGTGTGIWAIEYADLHPESEVIGVDLSPIQPSLVPVNCSFVIDDIEKDWEYNGKFDYVFARALTGSLASYPDFMKKAYDNLEPGGWIELQEMDIPYICDDDTLPPNLEVHKLGHLCASVYEAIGRTLSPMTNLSQWLKEAGFENIVDHRNKWPMNPWPKDPFYKEIGAWNLANMDSGLEGLCLALCTRVQGWSAEQTLTYCTVVRKQLRDQKIHGYYRVGVVYAQKPLDAELKQNILEIS